LRSVSYLNQEERGTQKQEKQEGRKKVKRERKEKHDGKL
jgi:hypothetical protein